MRALVQRVLKSELKVEGKEVSNIEKGLIVFIGVTHEDTENEAKVLAEKICKLRIFEDENEKMNLSLLDVGGELHLISQFTLYADCHHGNRPSFTNAAAPDYANKLYEYFIDTCKSLNVSKVETGIFGADMKINYINDGPISIMLECSGGKII